MKVSTFFDESNLRVGQNWPQALEQALTDSIGVAVFVGLEIGNWQWAEIGFALDRQLVEKAFPVIPVLLDGAETNRSFLFLNTWLDMRGEKFGDTVVINKLIEAICNPAVTSEQLPPADFNPYRGLEYFDEAQAPFFYGRESTIDDLFYRLTDARKNFVAVIGPSGSGKSSVVRAGLIPRLRRQRPPNETWDIATMTPGERPWFRLADALAPLRFPDKVDADLDIQVDKLHRALEVGDLDLISLLDRILKRQGRLHRLLLVVDQFEELFTLTAPVQRLRFVDALLGTLSLTHVVVMPTLRADFYGHAIDVNRNLSDLLGAEQVTLGRLNSEELRRTIVEPAKRAHLNFDPGLVELLLRDAGNEPGNLPLLQHALLELYTRRQGARLTASGYQDIGGIRHAIATSAELEYCRLPDAQKMIARSVFTQLVRLARADEGLEDTRRRIPVCSLPEEATIIIDEFASARLRLLVKARARAITGDEKASFGLESDQETVEVAHEALIREWGRLRDWLNEDRSFYLWRQRLDQFLNEYLEHRCDIDYLLPSAALREAEEKIIGPMPEPLGPSRFKYIQASIDWRDQKRADQDALEHEAKEARVAKQQQEREYEKEQQAHAKLEAQRAQAQAFADRRRSILAIVAGVISIAILIIWALGDLR